MLGPADPCLYGGDGCPDGEYYNGCCILWGTPVVIDLGGRGFRLTDGASGVLFPLTNTAFNLQTSWTRPGGENAWLALDRNGNGKIDNGSELFGNYSEQPEPPPDAMKNGFRALRQFDAPSNGGNGDGLIDARDSVFPRLVLWLDRNHDGLTQTMELETLAARRITALELDYRLSPRTDQYGNRFRYLAKVHSAPGTVGRWAADVFLKVSRAHRH
jgi:hypothetical protein